MPKTPPTHPDGIARIKAVIHDLRSPGGCPWDQEQTHASLLPCLLEEAYEVVEAVQSGDLPHLQEELGDLLLQIVLHSEIASETGAFDLDAVAHGISEKLIRRHPHVYSTTQITDTAGVLQQWAEIKKTEKGRPTTPGTLTGVPLHLPALTRAAKLQKKAAKVGFDWPDTRGIIEKIHEETREVEAAITAADDKETALEIGDLLFSVVNLARKLGHDPEILMTAANHKFTHRFEKMETRLAATSTPLGTADLPTMEAAWQQAKTTP